LCTQSILVGAGAGTVAISFLCPEPHKNDAAPQRWFYLLYSSNTHVVFEPLKQIFDVILYFFIFSLYPKHLTNKSYQSIFLCIYIQKKCAE
jgi:hypothetical protein